MFFRITQFRIAEKDTFLSLPVLLFTQRENQKIKQKVVNETMFLCSQIYVAQKKLRDGQKPSQNVLTAPESEIGLSLCLEYDDCTD